LPPPRRRNPRKPHARLALTQLEARENPATPYGLTSFSSLLNSYGFTPGFTETHAIGRSETKSVTIDQAGSGSAGTFTVTINTASTTSDVASGSTSASSYSTITATGTLTGQSVAHQVISGTYANGAFTVTSDTYTETGSSSVIQSTTTDWSSMYLQRVDTSRTSNYALSWAAAPDANGQLTYTSYDFTNSEVGRDYTRYETSGAGFSEITTDTAYTVHTVGSGQYATATGTDTRTTTMYSYSPNPNGSPLEYSYSDTWNNPVPSMAYLGMPYESTYGWVWNAGTSDATNYTFHGVSTEDSTLTVSLTAHDWGVDVNSFNSTSHMSDSSHVVNDEPGTPATGTETFHRDELYASATDVTGSGSYVGGSADANYHAVEIGNYTLANAYTVSNNTSSGIDEDGDPYTLTFNYASQSNGSGTATSTHDYHDSGAGLSLTGATVAFVGTSTLTSHSWGTRNGTIFDDTDTSTEVANDSLTLPGSAGIIGTSDVLNKSPTFTPEMTLPDAVFCSNPIPRRPIIAAGGFAAAIAFWNYRLGQVGDKAELKVGSLRATKYVLDELNNQKNAPGNVGGFANATGTFVLGPVPNEKPGGEGRIFIDAIKQNDKYNKALAQGTEVMDAQKWNKPKLAYTKLRITYAVDVTNAPNQARSGDVVLQYAVELYFTAEGREGVAVQTPPAVPLFRTSVVGHIIVSDDSIKEMKLK